MLIRCLTVQIFGQQGEIMDKDRELMHPALLRNRKVPDHSTGGYGTNYGPDAWPPIVGSAMMSDWFSEPFS